jgi:hypothetical protein
VIPVENGLTTYYIFPYRIVVVAVYFVEDVVFVALLPRVIVDDRVFLAECVPVY